MTVIRRPGLAPRQLTRGALRKLKDIPLLDTAGAKYRNGRRVLPPDKRICIMEATSYILGYDDITDSPACTSPVIRDFMIGLNDNRETTKRKRAMLKRLVPDIINTAPIIELRGGRVRTLESDPDFVRAELTRREMLDKYLAPTYGNYDELIERKAFRDIMQFVRELAAVAKFEAA